MTPTRHQFPLMLGPARNHPVNTREWAECIGNELDYQAEATMDNIDRFLAVVHQVMAGQPWLVWPDPPCGSADAYFQLCAGVTYGHLYLLIDTFNPEHGLPSPAPV